MIVLSTGMAFFAGACLAQAPQNADAPAQKELVIGTKEAQPFAMRATDGKWQGIDIDLWRHIAEDLQLHYRFAEVPNVEGLIDGVIAGKFDVAMAAITVTAGRARLLDFTQPFYSTGRWQRASPACGRGKRLRK